MENKEILLSIIDKIADEYIVTMVKNSNNLTEMNLFNILMKLDGERIDEKLLLFFIADKITNDIDFFSEESLTKLFNYGNYSITYELVRDLGIDYLTKDMLYNVYKRYNVREMTELVESKLWLF